MLLVSSQINALPNPRSQMPFCKGPLKIDSFCLLHLDLQSTLSYFLMKHEV